MKKFSNTSKSIAREHRSSDPASTNVENTLKVDERKPKKMLVSTDSTTFTLGKSRKNVNRENCLPLSHGVVFVLKSLA